ncbi:MAG: type II secretion system protein [Candidatus Falkowbacteria bacterium]
MFKQISNGVDRLKFNYFNKNKSVGFTLIELLVAISVIGFLVMSSVVVFNIVRMHARDAVRVGNIATISRALAMYLNDSKTGYPFSAGECLSVSSGVGSDLKTKQVLLIVPTDPLWPSVLPSNIGTDVNVGIAVSPSNNFCYYYFSEYYNQYKLSFFLESNSKSGNAGINTTVVTQ